MRLRIQPDVWWLENNIFVFFTFSFKKKINDFLSVFLRFFFLILPFKILRIFILVLKMHDLNLIPSNFKIILFLHKQSPILWDHLHRFYKNCHVILVSNLFSSLKYRGRQGGKRGPLASSTKANFHCSAVMTWSSCLFQRRR